MSLINPEEKMKCDKMIITEAVLDVVVQVYIKVPVKISKEEFEKRLGQNLPKIIRGATIHKYSLSEALDVPADFTVSHSHLDDVKWEGLKVDTFEEERSYGP